MSTKKQSGAILKQQLQTNIEEVVDQKDQTKEDQAKYIQETLNQLSEEEWTRFEFYFRSHFSKKRIREIMNEVFDNNSQLNDEVVISVSGLAKLFVGELCDTAMEVVKERNAEDKGFTPNVIIEAHRRMQREGKINDINGKRFLFDQNSLATCNPDFNEI